MRITMSGRRRWGALAGLAGSNPQVQEALLQRLDDEYGNVRAAAASALVGLAGSNTQVREALLQLLSDSEFLVGQAIIAALIQLDLIEEAPDGCWEQLVSWLSMEVIHRYLRLPGYEQLEKFRQDLG
jgi:hypothetical protein